MSNDYSDGQKTMGSLFKFLTDLFTPAPQMDTEGAQEIGAFSSRVKEFSYYGQRSLAYPRTKFQVEAIAAYYGEGDHTRNLGEVLEFLQDRHISYTLRNGDHLYIIPDDKRKQTAVRSAVPLCEGDFVVYRKSGIPSLFADTVEVYDAISMAVEFDLPQTVVSNPDDYSDEDFEAAESAALSETD